MRDQDQLDQRTKRNLVNVHRALQLVVERSPIAPGYQMCVTEGLRDMHRQEELLKAGKSRTMNSRHLTGHAFDFAMFDPSKSAPDDFVKKVDPAYQEQWKLFKETADKVDTEIEWGGNWPGFVDGTHVQLSWESYPIQKNPKTVGNSKTIAAAITGIPVSVLPEIATKVGSLTESLSFLDSKWTVVVQLVLTVGILVFIINERRRKIQLEGV